MKKYYDKLKVFNNTKETFNVSYKVDKESKQYSILLSEIVCILATDINDKYVFLVEITFKSGNTEELIIDKKIFTDLSFRWNEYVYNKKWWEFWR